MRQLLTTRISLFPQDSLADLISRNLSFERIEDMRLPYGALTTELMTSHGTLFTAGDIQTALLASTAIPGIYPPVEINGQLYVDGGMIANVLHYPAVA